MGKLVAVAAVSRLGLGARGSELVDARSDAPGWAKAQLVGLPASPAGFEGLPTAAEIVAAGAVARAGGDEAREAFRKAQRDQYAREAASRCAVRAISERPVLERMVALLANHFAVSVQKRPVVGLAGSLEREAIRPRATGRFADLLVAVTRHPAMLLYLDQAQSVGPNSKAGQRGDKGLNENLAREILELHTLGVDGGYGQPDVEAFARSLTGWSVGTEGGTADGFQFRPNRHEPGAVTILGKRYPEDGEAQALAVLNDLAVHPSTARFVCTQLARHFVADEPSTALVDAMVHTFLGSGGHLQHVLVTMIEHDACWAVDARKLRSPDDLVTAAARALDVRDGAVLARSLMRLGQAVWGPNSPAGWPDDAPSWMGPGALLERVEWAEDVADSAGDHVVAGDVLERTLGDRAGDKTRAAVAAAGDRRGLALLIASPDFQWR